jgi:mono/diheme cytochrome c family protein
MVEMLAIPPTDRVVSSGNPRLVARRCDISTWPIWGYLPVGIVLLTVWLQSISFAQAQSGGELKLDSGREIYEAACIACHGPGGKGQPKTTLGFEPPSTFPDFSDCNGATGEKDFDWRATIHEGGTGRGFSEIMPSFAEALTKEQIGKVIGYIRGFCSDPAWPRGELNLPRPLVTEKAFPENETVLTTAFNATGAPGVSNEIVYERRFGPKNQLEVSVPFAFQHQNSGSWFGGVGDLVLGYKRVIAHSTRSTLSLQGEVALPTGNKARGLGSGVTVFQAFGSYAQILPANSFVQFQGGAELPTHTDDAPKAIFWRTAVGKTVAQNKGFGRIWTPMVEFLGERDLATGAKTNWDLLPQLRVSLSKRQHIAANVGVRFPVNNTVGRTTQVMFYLLWDWFDGGLREGWK